MNSTSADIDKEAVRWSLSWKPDGRSDSFTREAILAAAPPTSGLYGLFNFDCQLFIGESANIQEALLRHESDADFQSGQLRPTGFTFEPCAAELRAAKAAELIARFRPVLQTESVMIEASSQSNSSIANKPRLDGPVLEIYRDHKEFPVDERQNHPKIHRRIYFNWTRGIGWAALFAASAIIVLYLGRLINKNIQERANGASEKSLPRVPIARATASGQGGIGSRAKNVSLTRTAGEIANQSAAPIPAKPDVDNSASAPAVNKKWSVQISAVPTKAVADSLVERLKGDGYDGHVVKAEVSGQTYYRVRVGRFDARVKAESVRQSLARQESYGDAYITND